MDAASARLRWELENNIQSTADGDALYRYNAQEEQTIRQIRPWTRDPHYFKKSSSIQLYSKMISSVRISALALLKMAMHAKSGGHLEASLHLNVHRSFCFQVMGLMQGKIQENAFVILDSFALPVEGTETRVNAMDSANVFMCEFINLNGVRAMSCALRDIKFRFWANKKT